MARGSLTQSEANFLGFLATAAYRRRVGDEPAALFSYLVRENRHPASQGG